MIYLLIFLWLSVGWYLVWLTLTSIKPVVTSTELFMILALGIAGPVAFIWWLAFAEPRSSKPIKWLSRKPR